MNNRYQDKMDSRIFKLDASAGSGKTYRLTLEYLSKLFCNFSPDKRPEFNDEREKVSSLLAITFTNKAANEMKERVIGRLKIFARSTTFNDLGMDDRQFLLELSEKSGLPKNQILDMADYILGIVIDHYSDFNIKTIDSLMNSIIKVISPDLDLSADYETGINIEDELNDEIRKYLDSLVKSNWAAVEEFLRDFKNTHGSSRWDLDEDISQNIVELSKKALYQEKNLEPVDDRVTEKRRETLFKSLRLFKEQIREFLAVVNDGSGRQYRNGSRMRQPFLDKLSLLSNNPDYFKSVSEVSVLLKSRFFKYEDPAVLVKKNCPEPIIETIRNGYFLLKKSLADFLIHLSIFRLIHYHRFLKEFSDFWIKNKQRIYVSEFSRKIRDKFIEWGDVLPYLYLKLSDRYHHILIDEFQDTSKLQFKALFPIIDEILNLEEASSLFVVGDRKQAIYRWRGGDSDLMEEEIFKKNARTLKDNWRSGSGVINFNNAFWEPVQISQVKKGELYKNKIEENFKNSYQEIPSPRKNKKGYVNVRIRKLDPKKEDHSAENQEKILFKEIVKDIKRGLNRGCAPGDIAILVRKSETGRRIIRFLVENQIEAISDESLFLSSSNLINEIVCFFKFLDYPPDNLSFYSFIRGTIFQKAAGGLLTDNLTLLEDLEIIASGEKTYYKLFQKKWPELWKSLIQPFFSSAGFLPAYDLFQDFICCYSLYETFPDSSVFFMTFASMLHDLEQMGKNSLPAFLDEWDMRIESGKEYAVDIAEDPTRVKVLTIHKSKGLEFPMVIVPLTDSRGKESASFTSRGQFFYITSPYAEISDSLCQIYKDDLEKSFIDNLNLLYVAFTRPSRWLSVPVVVKDNQNKEKPQGEVSKFPGFGSIVESHPLFTDMEFGRSGWMEAEFGELPVFRKDLPPPGTVGIQVVSKKVLTSKWQRDFLIFNTGTYLDKKERAVLSRGEAVHRILEGLGKFESRENLVHELERLFRFEHELKQDDLGILTTLLTGDAVFPFFSGDFACYNEKSVLCDLKDGNGFQYIRIDRLLVFKDYFVVLDYKTGNRKGADRDQVLNYHKALKGIYPKLHGRIFLLYIDLNELEEIPC